MLRYFVLFFFAALGSQLPAAGSVGLGQLNIHSPQPAIPTWAADVQPVEIHPAQVCPGDAIELVAPPGELFPPHNPDLAVMFAPCGIPGTIIGHVGDRIMVEVPERAISGPVWLAQVSEWEAEFTRDQSNACLETLRPGPVPAKEPIVQCDHRPNAPLHPDPASNPADPRAGVDAFAQECFAWEPDPAPGMHIELPPDSNWFFAVYQKLHPESLCFDVCNELEVPGAVGGDDPGAQLPLPLNYLQITPVPKIGDFGARDATRTFQDTWVVERGQVTFEWQTNAVPGASVELQVGHGHVAGVPASGDDVYEVTEPTQATLTTYGSCGTESKVVTLVPSSTLRVSSQNLALAPGQYQSFNVEIDRPLPVAVDLNVETTSESAITIRTPQVRIEAGQTTAQVTVERTTDSGWASDGTLLGQIVIRPDLATPVDLRVMPPKKPVEIRGGGGIGVHTAALTAQQVRVRGTLRYRDCGPGDLPQVPGVIDADRCLVDAAGPVFKPIRRARVEVWRQPPGWVASLEFAGETDENGNFEVILPAHPHDNYDVTVVASGPGGDVDQTNLAGTWFWRPLGNSQQAAGGTTLVFNFDADRDDSRHFNALDAMFTGWKYAVDRLGISEAQADDILRRVRIIPGTASSGVALPVGAATHIWVGSDTFIFEDDVVLHEYAHHLQRMNGTYALWPAVHDGCYATLADTAVGICESRRRQFQACGGPSDTLADGICWLNSPEYAWFEGFPEYFQTAARNWDAATAQRMSPSLRGPLWNPASCPCTLVTTNHFGRDGHPLTGADIEHYVASGLLELASQTGIQMGSATLTPEMVERLIFQIWFLDLKDQMPTIPSFINEWSNRLPNDSVLSSAFAPFNF